MEDEEPESVEEEVGNLVGREENAFETGVFVLRLVRTGDWTRRGVDFFLDKEASGVEAGRLVEDAALFKGCFDFLRGGEFDMGKI